MPERNETVVKHDSRIHSATATRYRYTLHVPAFYNDGEAVAGDTLDRIGRRCAEIAGGFIRVAAWGEWTADDGTIYSEAIWLYHLDVPSAQHGHTLREYADTLRVTLEQECVYVTGQTIDTWLV